MLCFGNSFYIFTAYSRVYFLEIVKSFGSNSLSVDDDDDDEVLSGSYDLPVR